MEPRTIRHYRVDSVIHRSSASTVYQAWDLDLDRKVALKELSSFHAGDPATSQRFVEEARLTASLQHRHVVVVYEFFVHEGLPYIAMEYFSRGTLRPLVGKLTQAQAFGVLDDGLGVLIAAEGRGVVHRDLKPENLMRTDYGDVSVADFGIAKAYERAQGLDLTPDDQFLGTPAYVAPEVVRGEPATTASDLYSLGVIAHELFTGSVPFADSESPSAFLVRKVGEAAPKVRHRAEVPDGAARWIDRCLQRNPRDRGVNASEARQALLVAADDALGQDWRHDSPLPLGPRAGVADDEPEPATIGNRFVGYGQVSGHAPPSRVLFYAATRPLNLLVGLALLLGAILLVSWLALVAVVAYAALVALTFFDERTLADVVERRSARRGVHAR